MNRNETEIPHYSEADVNAMLARIVPVRYQTHYAINDTMTFTFYPAGHIAGAACIYLKTSEGSVFYSGDISTFPQRTIEGMRIPRLRPDVGLFESTYGNRLHANRDAEEQKLVDTVKERIQQGGKVLIPSFALGRSQEVLLILQRAIRRRELPEVPVYADGMVRDITTCYLNHPLDLRAVIAKKILKGANPFYSETVQPVSPAMDREELLSKPGPAVFVASSGMLTGGPSMVYAKKLISEENASIIITGYQDEDAPGRLLLNMLDDKADQSISLDGTLLSRRCKVVQVGLSAHSDKSELTALIDRLSCRRVILIHGDPDAMNELGSELSHDPRIHVYEPSVGTELNIEIRHARMQLSSSFTDTMHGSTFSDPSEQNTFRTFMNEHYPNRSFTAEELYTLYTGREIHMEKISDEESKAIQTFMDQLDQSAYFSRDQRRMFLFRTNTDEEISELKHKQEPQMQDVDNIIKKDLQNIPVRKLSYYQDQKIVRILSDYPDAFPKDLLAKVQKDVNDETGWIVELGYSVNHQAVNAYLQSLFFGRIRKISHYDERKTYEVQLSSSDHADKERMHQFEKTTGWKLSIICQKDSSGTNSIIQAPDNGQPMEQNAAMSYIRSAFTQTDIKPYRISIKNDSDGRYLELSFLSPELGHTCDQLIKECADVIHWRLKVADSVNQNEIQGIVSAMAMKYSIPMKKAASYQPSTHTILLKTDAFIPDQMKEEFLKRTGLEIANK